MKTSILKDVIDLHVHCSPDVVPRAQDITQVVADAGRAGMAGLVLKEHTTSTVGRAFVLNHLFPQGPHLYSSLVLNPPVGSLNPVAVEAALRAGVDIIYFPTYGARHHIKKWGLGLPPTAFPVPESGFPGIGILDGEGSLKPVVLDILRLIASYDAVLATGHIAPAESLALLRAARQVGITRMVVTHASESVPGMPLDMQQEAAAMGAFIEHSFFAVTPSCPDPIRLEDIRDQVRAVGVARCILSSDFGQPSNGPVVEMFAGYLERMLRIGLSGEELYALTAENPARLLGRTSGSELQ